jgi:acetoin:2,6-dichlorophenolindophenol oxidoreductase subunit beta
VSTLDTASRTLNFRRAIAEALREEMERDSTVFVAGEDVGASGGAFGLTRGLHEQFGEWRVKDTPLSEQAIAGLAVGAALAGMRPVVEIMFMDFITLAMEQICNQAAKNRTLWGGRVRLPLVVRTMCGAGLRIGGHHSASLEAWFVHTPGLKVVYPSTPADAKGLLKSAIRDDGPVIFMEHKSLAALKGPVPAGDVVVRLGVADVKRAGRDCTVVATGWMVHRALAAAEKLGADGVEVEVIDPRTLSPLDTRTICESVRRTKRLVIVQEAPGPASFASEVSAVVAEQAIDFLDGPIKRVTGAFMPLPFGLLEDALIPQVDDIVAAVREIL